VKIVGIIASVLLPLAPQIAEAVTDQTCAKDSQMTGNPPSIVLIDSAACGTYKELTGHRTSDAGDPILVRYVVHKPKQASKGIVVLIAGGVLDTGIRGNAATGVVTEAGTNFLVRSAQIFADEGYTALTIDRPVKELDPEAAEFGDNALLWDHYRVASAKHAYDIVRVVAAENATNLPLFLAGTSRGSLAISNNMLGNGLLISSPVTVGEEVGGCPPNATCNLFITHSTYPRLTPAPGFVVVPVHVMAHEADACPVTPPDKARLLNNTLVALGVDSRFDMIQGGFADPGSDVCQSRHFHGFLGQENKAVKAHTKRMDDILKYWKQAFPNNVKPVVDDGLMNSGTGYSLDLSLLASDPGDTLTYILPHPVSVRGHALTLAGSVVAYAAPAGPVTDGFTFVVSDGKGGITASYVYITVP
jgi:hypothetical protein